MKLPGAVATKHHHVHPEDIVHEAEALVPGSSWQPKYSVIRDPYEQVRSMFYHTRVREKRLEYGQDKWEPTSADLLEFVKTFHNSWWFDRELYPYKRVSDKEFLYEDDLQFVVDEICMAAGCEIFPEVGVVGKSKGIPDGIITEEVREAINARFGEDVEYYNDLLDP